MSPTDKIVIHDNRTSVSLTHRVSEESMSNSKLPRRDLQRPLRPRFPGMLGMAALWAVVAPAAWSQVPAPLPATLIDAQLEAQAALPAVLGPNSALVPGTYTGIVGCRGVIDQFKLTLQIDARGFLAASYTRQPWVRPLPANAEPPFVGVPLRGSYSGRTGVFGLGPSTEGGRVVPQTRPVSLLGVFQADAKGVIMRSRVGQGSLCDLHVAVRGDEIPREWHAVAAQPAPRQPGRIGWALLGIPEKLQAARDALRTRCDAPIFPWLQQLSGLVDQDDLRRGAITPNLFSDPLFVPHFGKPFVQLSESDRSDFSIQLRGSCTVQKDDRLRAIASLVPADLAFAFMNAPHAFTDVDKAAANVVLGEFRRWRDHAHKRLEEVKDSAQQPGLVDQWIMATKPMTDMLVAAERKPFYELAEAAKRSMGLGFLLARIEQSPAATSPTFEKLERLVVQTRLARKELPTLPESDFQQVLQRLAAFVSDRGLAAADVEGNSANSPDDVHKLARWTEAYPQVWSVMSEPARTEASTRIERHRVALTQRLADEARQRIRRAAEPARPPLAALERLTREVRDLEGSHGGLLNEAAFEGYRTERDSVRAAATAAAESELGAALRGTGHLRPLKALRNQYLLASDAHSPAGSRLMQIYSRQAAEISPFSGYPAEDYLSAIYSGDWDAARQEDKRYAARLRNQTAATIGPALSLLEMIARGRRPGPAETSLTQAYLDETFSRLSLSTPMLALYLGRWQSEPNYRGCLEPSRRVEVRTTVTETMRYRFGLENTTTRESIQVFRVPERHAHLAERVGLTESRAFEALVMSFFQPIVGSELSTALDGVQKMMKELDCRSRTAERMDVQLVAYWQQR